MENVLKLLRAASIAREPYWNPDGNTVPASFRFIELAGEAGEVANAAKKLLRHQYGLVGGTDDTTNLKEELGDVLISLDLIAREFKIDLWECVTMKFNKTSQKHGFPIEFDRSGEFFWNKCKTCDNKIIAGSGYHDGTQGEGHCEDCRMQM